MYQVFLGYMPLPIAPSKIETVIGNRSSTIELINGDEVNIVKGAKLTEIQFEFLIPSQNYPFMTVAGSVVGAALGKFTGAVTSTAIIEYLKSLKEDKKPFQFIVVRLGAGLNITGLSNSYMTVTLEEYTITEDANNGMDYTCNVRLKEYKPFTTKVIDGNGNTTKVRP